MVGNDEITERVYEELDRFGWNAQELITCEEAQKKEEVLVAAFNQKV